MTQYLDNPLAAIANWYNQLTDGGLLMTSVGTPAHGTRTAVYQQPVGVRPIVEVVAV